MLQVWHQSAYKASGNALCFLCEFWFALQVLPKRGFRFSAYTSEKSKTFLQGRQEPMSACLPAKDRGDPGTTLLCPATAEQLLFLGQAGDCLPGGGEGD